jgi:alpha-beta hydrolase superfamily lysophospholipase
LKAIQKKVPFPVWVYSPYIIGDLPIPVGINFYMEEAKKQLKKAGYKGEKYFFGGHSLGGSSVSSWGKKRNDSQIEGVFLWGSYIGRDLVDPVANYGAPVLTVGAELDGWMARITRIAHSFD